jgi:2-succinyl-6-hydroxy-2,4-cyclohexadiene-1-carboxylate synthase
MYELAYELTGNSKGPVIVFIHGFLGSRRDWDDIVPYFKDSYHCLLLDLPGHGETKSLKDEQAYAMEYLALSVIKLLDDLKIKRCYLVGYSMGGRLALYLSIYFFERFYNVVLESASPGLELPEERLERIESDNQWVKMLEQAPIDDFLEKWYQQPFFSTLRKHRAFSQLIKQRKKNNGKALSHVLQAMGCGRQPALWYQLEHMVLPVLMVVGDEDDKYKAIASEMHLHYHRVQSKVVKHCGHNIHFENSIEYSKILLDFIGDHAKMSEEVKST